MGILAGRPAWVTECEVAGLRLAVRNLVRDWRPDVIQFEFHVMAQYVHSIAGLPGYRLLTEHEPGVPAARQRYRQRSSAGKILPRLDAAAWARYEPAMLAHMDGVVVFTDRDRKEISALAPRARVDTIPLGVDLPATAGDPGGEDGRRLLFWGNYVHGPNVAGAIRLARRIFPALQERFGDLTLDLVGPHPPPEVRALAGSGIFVRGEVPDLTPYLQKAAVCVLPLDLGGGMRLKTLEALAAGKAVVATRLAAEGIAVGHDRELLLAESDEDFVNATGRLLDSATDRRRLGAAGRRWIATHLNWDRYAAAYEAIYETRGLAISRSLQTGAR